MTEGTLALARLADRSARLARAIGGLRTAAERGGVVRAFDGMLIEAEGLHAPRGALARVEGVDGPVPAEVVGFRDARLLLMALSHGRIAPGAALLLSDPLDSVPTGPTTLGRVIDALGRPLDGGGALSGAPWPLAGRPVPPLARAEVSAPLETGVRAIDALLTLGAGQRIGLLAGAGVGKSVLMQQMVRGTAADAIIAALIGERGREIAAFLAALTPARIARTTVVAVPADEAAPLRIRGAMVAFAMAEALRDEGLSVLLLVDSLTRIAHAQREIGMAIGEPPGPRGYPASALALIPRLVERAGRDARSGGAITAIVTVLAEGDDHMADPVADAARGVLDGHVLLSREVAARGRFPAIDLGHSVSRTMSACVDAEHARAAASLRRDWALIEASRDLVAMGAHTPGVDPALDRALAHAGAIEAFLAQAEAESVPFAESRAALLEGWGA
jgi:flagellum-specific ATP synthase